MTTSRIKLTLVLLASILALASFLLGGYLEKLAGQKEQRRIQVRNALAEIIVGLNLSAELREGKNQAALRSINGGMERAVSTIIANDAPGLEDAVF